MFMCCILCFDKKLIFIVVLLDDRLTKPDISFLQKIGQPIFERYMEAEERPKAFEEFGRQIQLYMKIIEAYKAKVTWHRKLVC